MHKIDQDSPAHFVKHQSTRIPNENSLSTTMLSVENIAQERGGADSVAIARLALAYPFYHAEPFAVRRILRKCVSMPPPRPYAGFDRLSRALRHVASATYRSMKTHFEVNPVEVQAAMIGGTLHISSNFHSESLIQALRLALVQGVTSPSVDDVVTSAKQRREMRHAAKLVHDYLTDEGASERVICKAVAEIRRGMGVPRHPHLSCDEIATQLAVGIRSLRDVLVGVAQGDNSGVVMHAPFHDAQVQRLVEPWATQTRHAEQNIVAHLACHRTALYAAALDRFGLPSGKPVIVPMEGRFVPCGACHEQEKGASAPGGGGVFDPQGRQFVLYRSGPRVGKFYANEVQYLSLEGLAGRYDASLERGRRLCRDIHDRPTALHTWGMDLVDESSLNTDSEDSASALTESENEAAMGAASLATKRSSMTPV